MADRTCSVEGCIRPARKRGLCGTHYERWRQHGDPGVNLRPGTNKGKTCSVEGCTNKAQARGLCGKHYQQDRAVRNGAAQCRRAGCTLLAVLDGLCKPHYDRRRRMDDERELRDARECSVEGCDRPYDAGGFCQLHYYRNQKTGSPGPAELLRAPNGTGYIGKSGYRYFKTTDGRSIFEHRLVMERLLGRPLVPGENVHHVNGQRADNRTDGPLVNFRSGNLELWLTAQPSGQRVADLIAFVVEHYRAEVEQALNGS